MKSFSSKNASGHSGDNLGESGFTLIDVAIFLVMISLMLVPVLQIHSIKQKREFQKAEDLVFDAELALRQYAMQYGYYPIPANATINIDDPDTATRVRAGKSVTPANLTTVATCNSGTAPIKDGILCRRGTRNLNDSGGLRIQTLAGAIPYAAIGMTAEGTIDPYGNKLIYVISRNLTSAATFVDGNGVIAVRNQTNASLTTSDNAQFVVLSTGRDGIGGYRRNGVKNTCTTNTSTNLQSENCNDDSIFRQFMVSFDKLKRNGTLLETVSRAAPSEGTTSFDDKLAFVESMYGSGAKRWTARPSTEYVYMTNGNNGKVGIKQPKPTSAMSVKGNARATAASTPKFCNATGTIKCFDTAPLFEDTVDATTLICNTDYALRSIDISGSGTASLAKKNCDLITRAPAAILNNVCVNGAKSISTTGTFVCN